MKQKEIRVLMVEPGKNPKVTTLQNDLDSLQKAVSIGADYQGLIEIISIGNGDCILCNGEGNLISLSEKKIQYYQKLFWEPQTFDRADIEETLYMYFS